MADLASGDGPNSHPVTVDPGRIEPGVWYFPADLTGNHGQWISLFNAEDWAQYGPPGEGVDGDGGTVGFVFYQMLFDPNPGPFKTDTMFPAPIRVPAFGVHPPAPAD